MSKREKIKSKVNALLAKTTENGASKEEMESALAKANQLMVDFFISENDLKDPYISENCVLEKFERVKSGYDLTGFFHSLSLLFDCEHYFTKKEISFFGFEEDVKLCGYFYKFITDSALIEKDKFTKSEKYLSLKRVYHGKTLASSFLKGFIKAVSVKMKVMYQNRESQLSSDQFGLMVIDKKNKVDFQFKNLDLKIRTIPNKRIRAESVAYDEGVLKGEKLKIVQGVNGSDFSNVKLIS